MRIVIDLEAAQSPMSRNRGIGRYSMALAKGMLRQRGGHEILVALNGMYADTVVPVREALDGLVEQPDIRVWHASIPPHRPVSPAERRAGERLRHSFLESLAPDVVHVASLFEHDPLSFTTIGTFPSRHSTAVTLYDLIPHLNREVYFASEGMSRPYDEKLDHLKRADMWLAISGSSRQEGIEHLGLRDDRVTNISSAADEHFVPSPVAADTEVMLRVGYGLWRPFVMYTGGIDPRKNVDGLVRAWAKLPADLRASHQLAIVCSVQPHDRERLNALAASEGLREGELVITGFVPEDHLVLLYRMCKLFVFPSLHEGFGLPALEAMSCGAATIGANNSSIPEVIGRDDALFDARSADAIAASIQRCLADDGFREELARWGPRQARNFSWDKSARVALDAIEAACSEPRAPLPVRAGRLRLAYVSPLPPARSGIADYSAELLPALAQHYDIDVVVHQPELDASVAAGVRAVRELPWFEKHAHEYDRILYQMGNSQFHEHMVPLMRVHPGTVVLHDFFMSGMQANRELVTQKRPYWTRALYDSHGWRALVQRVKTTDVVATIREFPANFDVLRDAQGIIVHSPYSRRLAREWYGPGADEGFRLIPHLRIALPLDRERARAQLGLSPQDILVCSFGMLDTTKMNDRLMRAWTLSSLSMDAHCHLVFVGENDAGDFGRKLLQDMQGAGGRVRITGWASPEMFRLYLNAADFAVQLRTLSRGETSGTVLDAMNHALPVVANANGTMAYLPREAVMLLDEDFTDAQLVEALERLRNDAALRRAMGDAARRIIETRHSPADCAQSYRDAIESFAGRVPGPAAVAREVAHELGAAIDPLVLASIANAIARSLPEPAPARQLLVDVSAFVADPASLPPLVPELILHTYAGWRLEPVYLAPGGEWRYARGCMLRYYDCPQDMLADEPVEMRTHDVWCLLEGAPSELPQAVRFAGLEPISPPASSDAQLVWAYIAATTQSPRGERWFVDVSELARRDWKAGIQRVVKNYLLELLRKPPPGVTVVPVFARDHAIGYFYAEGVLRRLAGFAADAQDDAGRAIDMRGGDTFFALDLQPGFIKENRAYLREQRSRGVRIAYMVYDLLPVNLPDCFLPDAGVHHEEWLQAVAESDVAVCISASVADELSQWMRQRGIAQAPQVQHVHLGGDFGTADRTSGNPEDAPQLLRAAQEHPAFLMVGTLEPRKSHAQVLDAFEVLWSRGSDAVLVISGREGWMTQDLVQRLRAHAELGHRLFWLEGASDEFLEQLYGVCAAMIFASRGEGFGLPLVEAARHGLAIIARDLPVSREVAGRHAFYFTDDSPQALAGSIEEWLAQKRQGTHPQSRSMPWLTWSQSAAQLRRVLE